MEILQSPTGIAKWHFTQFNTITAALSRVIPSLYSWAKPILGDLHWKNTNTIHAKINLPRKYLSPHNHQKIPSTGREVTTVTRTPNVHGLQSLFNKFWDSTDITTILHLNCETFDQNQMVNNRVTSSLSNLHFSWRMKNAFACYMSLRLANTQTP